MPFTGILGGSSSILGNLVLGLSNGFGPNAFGYKVHVLTSKTIRVLFDVKVNLSKALDPSKFSLSSINPPTLAYTPSIIDVKEYEEGGYELELILSGSLTHNELYSIQISPIPSSDGSFVVTGAAHNFRANVTDPPRAIGVYLSKRGFVDVVFDRPVGPFTTNPIASLSNLDVSVTVPISYVAWDSTIPQNHLRFSLPVGAPLSTDWLIHYSSVSDISFNVGSGTVKIIIPDSISRPLNYASVTQLQVTDAYVTNHNPYLGFSNVRFFFNCPISKASALNTLNWSIVQVDTHNATDTVNIITEPDATDLVSLISLINTVKQKFNRHLSEYNVHYANDQLNIVNVPDAVDQISARSLLNELQSKYISHISSDRPHLGADPNSYTYVDSSLSTVIRCCITLNGLKSAFNNHLSNVYDSSLVSFPLIGSVDASFTTYESYEEKDEKTWCVDLKIKSLSPNSKFVVSYSIDSEDLGSSTVGSVSPRPISNTAISYGLQVVPDKSVSIKFDKELYINSDSSFEIKKNHLSFKKITGIREAFWALTELWLAFDYHRINQLHSVTDYDNAMTSYDIPIIDVMIGSANSLLHKFRYHRTSSYHIHNDPYRFNLTDATDEESFINLVEKICEAFDAHTINDGLHNGQSLRLRSAPLFNEASLLLPPLLDNTSYEIKLNLGSLNKDVRSLDIVVPINYSVSFTNVASIPCIADAVPRTGLSHYNGQERFMSDEVQVFFSKNMMMDDLLSISLSGGSIVVKEKSWINKNKASVIINNMQNVTYSVSASGLKDVAGNQIP